MEQGFNPPFTPSSQDKHQNLDSNPLGAASPSPSATSAPPARPPVLHSISTNSFASYQTSPSTSTPGGESLYTDAQNWPYDSSSMTTSLDDVSLTTSSTSLDPPSPNRNQLPKANCHLNLESEEQDEISLSAIDHHLSLLSDPSIHHHFGHSTLMDAVTPNAISKPASFGALDLSLEPSKIQMLDSVPTSTFTPKSSVFPHNSTNITRTEMYNNVSPPTTEEDHHHSDEHPDHSPIMSPISSVAADQEDTFRTETEDNDDCFSDFSNGKPWEDASIEQVTKLAFKKGPFLPLLDLQVDQSRLDFDLSPPTPTVQTSAEPRGIETEVEESSSPVNSHVTIDDTKDEPVSMPRDQDLDFVKDFESSPSEANQHSLASDEPIAIEHSTSELIDQKVDNIDSPEQSLPDQAPLIQPTDQGTTDIEDSSADVDLPSEVSHNASNSADLVSSEPARLTSEQPSTVSTIEDCSKDLPVMEASNGITSESAESSDRSVSPEPNSTNFSDLDLFPAPVGLVMGAPQTSLIPHSSTHIEKAVDNLESDETAQSKDSSEEHSPLSNTQDVAPDEAVVTHNQSTAESDVEDNKAPEMPVESSPAISTESESTRESLLSSDAQDLEAVKSDAPISAVAVQSDSDDERTAASDSEADETHLSEPIPQVATPRESTDEPSPLPEAEVVKHESNEPVCALAYQRNSIDSSLSALDDAETNEAVHTPVSLNSPIASAATENELADQSSASSPVLEDQISASSDVEVDQSVEEPPQSLQSDSVAVIQQGSMDETTPSSDVEVETVKPQEVVEPVLSVVEPINLSSSAPDAEGLRYMASATQLDEPIVAMATQSESIHKRLSVSDAEVESVAMRESAEPAFSPASHGESTDQCSPAPDAEVVESVETLPESTEPTSKDANQRYSIDEQSPSPDGEGECLALVTPLASAEEVLPAHDHVSLPEPTDEQIPDKKAEVGSEEKLTQVAQQIPCEVEPNSALIDEDLPGINASDNYELPPITSQDQPLPLVACEPMLENPSAQIITPSDVLPEIISTPALTSSSYPATENQDESADSKAAFQANPITPDILHELENQERVPTTVPESTQNHDIDPHAVSMPRRTPTIGLPPVPSTFESSGQDSSRGSLGLAVRRSKSMSRNFFRSRGRKEAPVSPSISVPETTTMASATSVEGSKALKKKRSLSALKRKALLTWRQHSESPPELPNTPIKISDPSKFPEPSADTPSKGKSSRALQPDEAQPGPTKKDNASKRMSRQTLAEKAFPPVPSASMNRTGSTKKSRRRPTSDSDSPPLMPTQPTIGGVGYSPMISTNTGSPKKKRVIGGGQQRLNEFFQKLLGRKSTDVSSRRA